MCIEFTKAVPRHQQSHEVTIRLFVLITGCRLNEDVTVSFRGITIYGQRKAVHPCLFVTSKHAQNQFIKSPLTRIAGDKTP